MTWFSALQILLKLPNLFTSFNWEIVNDVISVIKELWTQLICGGCTCSNASLTFNMKFLSLSNMDIWRNIWTTLWRNQVETIVANTSVRNCSHLVYLDLCATLKYNCVVKHLTRRSAEKLSRKKRATTGEVSVDCAAGSVYSTADATCSK